MYFIIVGAGKLGYYLTHLLLDENHDCVVIDKDSVRCDQLSAELDIVCINGDGTNPKTLDEAGIKEADAVVALTAQDETNMVISLLAKDLGAKSVAARISRIEYNEDVLKKLGIDVVIHPEAAAAGYIEELITKPDVLDLAFISRGQAEIMEIQVQKGSKIAGKKIKEINLPIGSAIVAIVEDKEFIIPDSSKTIKVGTKLLVISKREVANKVRKIIK